MAMARIVALPLADTLGSVSKPGATIAKCPCHETHHSRIHLCCCFGLHAGESLSKFRTSYFGISRSHRESQLLAAARYSRTTRDGNQ
jgi:hypothetical protein